jgi:hypothetical protein
MRRRHIESRITSAAGKLSGQEADEGEPQPLPETKGPHQLLFNVLKRGIYGISGGKWQRTSVLRNARRGKGTPNKIRDQ